MNMKTPIKRNLQFVSVGILGVAALLVALSTSAGREPPPQLVITSAFADLKAQSPSLFIEGLGFGEDPVVWIGVAGGGQEELPVVFASDNLIQAELPVLDPGTYLLTVFGDRGDFDTVVTIGGDDDEGLNFPVGSIVAWHKSFENTPPLPDEWVECNGQVLNDPRSPYDGQTIPDLNGQARFLRGASTSGTNQSSAFGSHSHGVGTYAAATAGDHGHSGSVSIDSTDLRSHAHGGSTGSFDSQHAHGGSSGSVALQHNHGGSSGSFNSQHNHVVKEDSVNLAHDHNVSTQNDTHAHTVTIKNATVELPIAFALFAGFTGQGLTTSFVSTGDTHNHGINQSAVLGSHTHNASTNNSLGSHDHSVSIDNALGSHDHSVSIDSALGSHDHTVGIDSADLGSHTHGGTTSTTSAGDHSHSLSGDAGFEGDSETRPDNMSVVWIMKVRFSGDDDDDDDDDDESAEDLFLRAIDGMLGPQKPVSPDEGRTEIDKDAKKQRRPGIE